MDGNTLTKRRIESYVEKEDMKGVMYISHIMMILSFFGFSIWFTVMMFRTYEHVYPWVSLYLYHGITLILFSIYTYSYIHTYKNTVKGSPDRAIYSYPRYMWEIGTWFTILILFWLLTLSMNIWLVVKRGNVYYIDIENIFDIIAYNLFRFVYILNIACSLTCMIISMSTFYTILCKSFTVKKISEIQSSISKTNLIELKRR